MSAYGQLWSATGGQRAATSPWMLQMDKLKYTETVIGIGVKLGVSSKGMVSATDVNADDNI